MDLREMDSGYVNYFELTHSEAADGLR